PPAGMSLVVFPISESDHERALVKPAFAAKIVHGSGRCKSVVRFLANAIRLHPRRMRSSREISPRSAAKIRRGRCTREVAPSYQIKHFSPGYVDYPQETI